MCHDIIAAIECNAMLLTRLEKAVAKYVLVHGREVLSLSISELASNCGVAVSTVFRFCQRLHLSGYREFLLLLAVALEKRESAALSGGDSGGIPIINELFQRRLMLLHEMYRLLSEAYLDEPVRRLETADRIILVGIGSSLGTVINAYQRLLSIGAHVFFAHETHTQRLLTNTLTERDVVIAFSCASDDSELAPMLENAKRGGAYLITLTPSPASKLSALADWTFSVAGQCGEALDQFLFFESYTFVIDVLCGLYRRKWTYRAEASACPSQPPESDDFSDYIDIFS